MGRPKKKLEIDSVKVRYKTLADGRQSIYLDYNKDGKRSYDFLQLYLLPETNSENKRKNKATMKIVEEKQRALTFKILESGTAKTDEPLFPDMLLSDWMTYYAEQQRKYGVKDIKCILKTRLLLMNVNAEIKMSEVDKSFCVKFLDYLRNDYRTRLGKKINELTSWSYQGRFRAALNAAVRAGVIKRNPWLQVERSEKFVMTESQREYLTIDEVKTLIDTPCYNPMVKRAFLFCCFTGLRYSDMEALKWKDIYQDDGKWLIQIIMIKTKAPIVVPLAERAREFLPEPGDSDGDDLVFTHLPDRCDMSLHLHNWMWSAGIKKHITFHCARHTFATMMLTVGVDLYVVSKLMGHKDTRQTQIYAKIIDKKKDDAVNLADPIFEALHPRE